MYGIGWNYNGGIGNYNLEGIILKGIILLCRRDNNLRNYNVRNYNVWNYNVKLYKEAGNGKL